jgi:hypothetical protein
MAKVRTNPLDAYIDSKPAQWARDFRVPKPPSFRESLNGRNLTDAAAHHDLALAEWSQALERSINERIQVPDQTATTQAAAPASAPSAPAPAPSAPVDLTEILSRLSNLESAAGAQGTGRVIVFCSAFTPAATGADTGEVTVPSNPSGSTTWNVAAIRLRVQTAGGAPSITIEASSAATAFVATTVGSVTLGTGDYEGITIAGLPTVTVGDKLRFNVIDLGTAQNWTIEVELVGV